MILVCVCVHAFVFVCVTLTLRNCELGWLKPMQIKPNPFFRSLSPASNETCQALPQVSQLWSCYLTWQNLRGPTNVTKALKKWVWPY